MAKELEQPAQRRPKSYFDRHDRKWTTVIDIRTGHSCGPWEPQFTAPVYPEMKYIRHDLKDDRYIIIDYDRWIRDARDAADGYDDFRQKTAIDQYGSAFTSKLGVTPDEDLPELRRLVGEPPKPVEFPEACKAGNKWALGLTNVIPTWAYALLPRATAPVRKYLDADEEVVEKAVTLDEQFDPKATGGKRVPVPRKSGQSEYTAFMGEQRRAGKSLKEISQLWKEYKGAAVAA